MVTQEQVLTCKNFLQIREYCNNYSTTYQPGNIINLGIIDCKPVRWRANGKCKTWKRNPERFQLPIKHGLYNYAYITNENAHLFIVDET